MAPKGGGDIAVDCTLAWRARARDLDRIEPGVRMIAASDQIERREGERLRARDSARSLCAHRSNFAGCNSLAKKGSPAPT